MSKQLVFFMGKIYLLLLIMLNVPVVYAESEILLRSQLYVEGFVVGSTCSVKIEGNNGSMIDFGEYNQASQTGLRTVPFFVKLFQDDPSSPGCDAFMGTPGRVTLKFGGDSTNQLDESGVVTHGAGGDIRIAITSTDEKANVDSKGKIISGHSELTYSKDFAQEGVFSFSARAEGLQEADAGRYHGSLSLVMSYK
ncbi:type 1 fimbrial protein [Moritella sp. 36]|uniref:type 1 fimbrial protein n=1 Tax=Moritella sp. 36 TaxID=2746233 RepID=UPI001BAAB388|nr:type 1 fimbrial protein [Moritella sp. 36]QUM88181.1 type 1 fimbrial protein [Moritella sp. 36]